MNRTPSGTTVVVHKIRVKLNLTLAEYVIADAMFQRELNSKQFSFDALESETGLLKIEIADIIQSLEIKGIIHSGQRDGVDTIELTSTWKKEFDVSADFEEFWSEIWKRRGNKKAALKQYIAARKIVEKDRLHSAARAKVAAASEWQYIPYAEKWLNPKYEKWNDENVQIEVTEGNNQPRQVTI